MAQAEKAEARCHDRRELGVGDEWDAMTKRVSGRGAGVTEGRELDRALTRSTATNASPPDSRRLLHRTTSPGANAQRSSGPGLPRMR